jgi:hypothetical protein
VALPVDILIDGRRIGCAYWGYDGGLLSAAVTRPSTSTAPLVSRRECLHRNTQDGFAYFEHYDEHWPIRLAWTAARFSRVETHTRIGNAAERGSSAPKT